MVRREWAAALVATACFSGCAHAPGLLCPPDPTAGGDIEVRFLGVQGFLIRRGDVAVLTAPMFSNPSWFSVGLGTIYPNARIIADKTKPLERDLAKVVAILVGHGHYDHLMDVPLVFEKTPRATIYGNDTVERQLAPARLLRVKSLESRAVCYDAPDPDARWEYIPDEANAQVRVLAILSEHSPQFMHFRIFDAPAYTQPLARLPTTGCDWRAGQPLAYLIDFLQADRHTVAFRIHYSDSSVLAPCGFVPRELDAARPRKVDLALLTAGGSESMEPYPRNVLDQACAANALIGHWENFFEPADDARQPRALGGVKDLVTRTRLVQPAACLPRPGAAFRYASSGAGAGPCTPTLPVNTTRGCGCRGR